MHVVPPEIAADITRPSNDGSVIPPEIAAPSAMVSTTVSIALPR